MKTKEDLVFQKTRSIAAIVNDAYQLYTENFKRLFRASWPIAIIYALTFALATFLLIHDVLPITVVVSHVTSVNWTAVLTACWQATAAIFLFILAALLLASTAFWACRTHKATGDIKRPAHWWGQWPGLWYIKMLWKSFIFFFHPGFRHFGVLFTTAFITMLFTVVLTLFCELPAIIIGIANIKAYTGEAAGDPLGMPDYLGTLTFIAFTIAGFIQAYVHLITVFPFYYAYGSIDTLEKEKKSIKL